MKKHILGIAIFSLIVISSFLLSYTVIPKADLMSTVETNQDLSSLDLNDLTFDILSVKYDSETNQVTQDIRFRWNGKGNPPKFIYVNSAFYTSEKSSAGDNRTNRVNLIFGNGMTADVLFMQSFKANAARNYYADIWLGKEAKGDYKPKSNSGAKTSPILFVH